MGSQSLNHVPPTENDSASGPSSLDPNQAALWRYIEHLEHWRQSIGYEIHDGLTQQITAALLFLEAAGREKPDPVLLDRCRSILEEALAESRRLIQGLNPKLLDEEGLEAALEEFLTHNTTLSEAIVRLDIAPTLPSLLSWQRSSLFRFLQEAITNARKHSDAGEIAVTVRTEGKQICAQVRDNGCGIESSAVRIGGHGLHGLQQKAELLGGTFDVESRPEQGTTVTLRFSPSPLP